MPSEAKQKLESAQTHNLIIDSRITARGNGQKLAMTHQLGVYNEDIHRLAWKTFATCIEVTKWLRLYRAGHKTCWQKPFGNIKGKGSGETALAFIEQKSEPIIIVMTDKTSIGV